MQVNFDNSFFTPRQLAQLWHISEKTLERWRMHGRGPIYYKIGGRVLYGMDQVQAHERHCMCLATHGNFPPDSDFSICSDEQVSV
jgi:hypothetical protein